MTPGAYAGFRKKGGAVYRRAQKKGGADRPEAKIFHIVLYGPKMSILILFLIMLKLNLDFGKLLDKFTKQTPKWEAKM